jgi:AraC-like DNA-binding protein
MDQPGSFPVQMTASTSPAIRREPIRRAVASECDLLTTLLEPCRFRSVIYDAWRLSSPWGIEMESVPPGFVLVLEANCRLELPEEGLTFTLQAGDMAFVTRKHRQVLRDRADSRTIPFRPADGQSPARESVLGGARCRLLCGRFESEDDYTEQTFALLPPVVVLHGQSPEVLAWFEPLVQVLITESERHASGSDLLIGHALQMLFVHALRQAAVDLPEAAGGLLSALRVPGLGAAMGAIHTQPEHEWTVHELAEIAGLSRAAFAVRFLETVGLPPFQYLRDVRMRLACRMLRETEKGIKEIASRVGYATEASFSKAFTRWCARAPGDYRRRCRNGEAVALPTVPAAESESDDIESNPS